MNEEPIELTAAVGTALRAARCKRSITQEVLADRTGIHQSDISMLENGGGNPTLLRLARLAEGLGCRLRIRIVPANEDEEEPHTYAKTEQGKGWWPDGLHAGI